MAEIAPSVLNADFSRAGEWLPQLEKAGAEWIHWDIMDNKFVPNSGVEMKWIPELRKKTGILFDCHLMVEKPETYFKKLGEFGADLITFHVEAAKKPEETIRQIRKSGLKVGIAINNETAAEKIFPFLGMADIALVMGVQAGFGGQSFNPKALEKIALLKKKSEKEKLGCKIQVDGGINLETGKQCTMAGADVLVAGSFVFKSKNMEETILELKRL
ncbi:MAG: ribulose-phosphate 3-epimerase [Candidatus ainarchaeum sp.]|nr:ribulose-phosphate 3-epimerase [Candidatus ainarchaeum sp.]